MKVRFQKKHPLAVIPAKATSGSAGYDLTAVALEDTPTCYKYHTGIAVEIPPGHVGYIFPRSSVAKKGAWMSNSVGVIDQCRNCAKSQLNGGDCPLIWKDNDCRGFEPTTTTKEETNETETP
jgi:hypothetical protein